jgi:uncharacterized protein (DUF885 family)
MLRFLLATIPGLVLSTSACTVERVGRSPTEPLRQLFEETWAFELAEDPLLATAAGVGDYNDRLPSVALADLERRDRYWREALERLEAVDRGALGAQDRINYDMFRSRLGNRIRDYELGGHLLPLTVDNGFHIAFARLPSQMPMRHADDYQNYISRLRSAPQYFEQYTDLLREGVARGMTLSRVILDGYDVTIATHVVDDAQASVFWAPFERFPGAMATADRERLASEGARVIIESVVPAYEGFLAFMLDEYIPAARATIGAHDLPNGREYYQHQIQVFTTLDLTAEEIHQVGLDEVARIRTEMEGIIEAFGFEGTFADFLTFLRTDSRFYAATPEELLKEASYIAKEMDGKLPSLFRTLPRLPYGVNPVPDHLAPKYTGGRYVGAPLGGTSAGFYWVNTYALESRPLYTLTSLTLHEAVPGHHLQNALRQELEGLPDFRRFSSNSAFGEGWGLYSEYLGIEAGMYKTPYDDFGRLTYEMWRACRLVVDTGMHALGWTREQALDFMASNTALSLHEVRTETDRYISWPGQALAYKLGELKIKELRRRAEAELGDQFDIRAFHDAVLLNGAIPLPVLENEIDRFIELSREGP